MNKQAKKPNEALRYQRKRRGWSQKRLADLIDASREEISRWECGWQTPGPYYREKLCQIFNLTAIELGFLPGTASEAEPDTDSITELVASLTTINQKLHDLLPLLYGILEAAQAGGKDMDSIRRELLTWTARLAGISLLTPSQLISMNFNSGLFSEEILPQWRTNLQTFWKQYFAGNGMAVEQLLPGFLSQLTTAVPLTKADQKEVAGMAAQGYLLQWILTLQHQNFGQAFEASEQAFEYAQVAEDPNLMLASLVRQAHIFFHTDEPLRRLQTLERAMQYKDEATPYLQSWLYSTIAETHANLGQEYETQQFFELSRKMLPNDPRQNPYHTTITLSPSMVVNFESRAYIHLNQPLKALDGLTQQTKADPNTPFTRQVELMNRQLETYCALGELEEACKQFEAALSAAQRVNSPLRRSEVSKAYRAMRARWPREERVKRLEDTLKRE